MTGPETPLIAGMVPEPFSQLLPWIALGIAVYWLYLLYRRTVQSSADPSYRKFSSSRLGSASFLVSGAYMSAAIAGLIAVLTWPLPLENQFVAGGLIGLVVFHAVIEYRESGGS